MYCLSAEVQPPHQSAISAPLYSGDCARDASTEASAVPDDRVGALPNDGASPSIVGLAPAAVVPPFELAIGSGDSVRSIAIC